MVELELWQGEIVISKKRTLFFCINFMTIVFTHMNIFHLRFCIFPVGKLLKIIFSIVAWYNILFLFT